MLDRGRSALPMVRMRVWLLMCLMCLGVIMLGPMGAAGAGQEPGLYYQGVKGRAGDLGDVLLSFGTARREMNLLLVCEVGDEEDDMVDKVKVQGVNRRVVTDWEVGNLQRVAKNMLNMTVALEFEGEGGKSPFTVEAECDGQKVRLDGQLAVVGVQIGQKGMSGEYGKGLKWPGWKAVSERRLDLKGWGNGGRALSSGEVAKMMKVDVRDGKGLLDRNGVYLDKNQLVISPHKYRVSRGPVNINLIFDELEVDGEALETMLSVEVGHRDVPVPVVFGPKVVNTGSGRRFTLNCFNMVDGNTRVEDVSLTTPGGYSIMYMASESTLGPVNQNLVFMVTSAPKKTDAGDYPMGRLSARFSDGSTREVAQEQQIMFKFDSSAPAPMGENENNVSAVSLGSSVPVWGIVLIAVGAAFALILVVAFLISNYSSRRSAANESSYSSSGPLGVPAESCTSPEDAIVRDTYARGDVLIDGGRAFDRTSQTASSFISDEASSKYSL